MLVPGKSYPKPEDGFVRASDAQAAKRRFQVSAALVFVLAVAAVVLGMFAPPNRPASAGRPMIRLGSAEDLLPSHAHYGTAAGLPAESLKEVP